MSLPCFVPPSGIPNDDAHDAVAIASKVDPIATAARDRLTEPSPRTRLGPCAGT